MRRTRSAFCCTKRVPAASPEAAYRFARHEPGVDVVLFGTGDPDHLRANIASLLAPPLPLADRLTLTKLFGRLSGVGLDPSYSMPGISSP